LKKCRKCGEEKPLDMFYMMKGMRDGHRNECKACSLAAKHENYSRNRDREIARVKKWQQENRDRHLERQRRRRQDPEVKRRERAGHLKRKFGISLEDYDRLLAEQHGGCAICGDPPEPGTHLHVDHDHEDGRVRGLLCVRCNNGLGQFKEDDALIDEAAAYARRTPEDEHLIELARNRARELVRSAR
jgi:hypothetical protein